MTNLQREIKSETMRINVFVEEKLTKDKILIPTFQRDFVWEPENILKLWDSIYKFYPVGSMLYWVTDTYLHTHRKIGGFKFPHDEETLRQFKEWEYILDGQQRATSLLVSLMGGKGKVKENENFDYTVYFDATTADFFFEKDLQRRKTKVNPAFLLRLKDVTKGDFLSYYERIFNEPGINESIKNNIKQLYRIFTDYMLVFVRIQGVDVDEVTEIFERVNQEGKRLDPVDIIVARTYRNENREKGITMFYLRDNLEALKKTLSPIGNRFREIDDYALIQMFSICLRKDESGDRKSFGITPKALDNLTTDSLEKNWDNCQKTIFETIKFLSDLKIQGPNMLPNAYLLFPLCHYFYKNPNPNKHLAKQWFWRTVFGDEDFRRADQVYDYCNNYFDKIEKGEKTALSELVLSKSKLVKTSYYYRSSLSRAVLALLAKQNPLDFSDPDAEVLDDVYLLLSQAPNLHHIYPQNFLENVNDLPQEADINSLMNICYLRAKTNIKIGDKNPLDYFNEFKDVKNFEKILESHLIPKEFLSRNEFQPKDYKDFLYARAQLVCQRIKDELPDVIVKIIE